MRKYRKEMMFLIDTFDLELQATYVNERSKTFDPPLTREQIVEKMK